MRHKFLMLLEQQINEQDRVMEGIVEIDETYVPDSYNGIIRTDCRKSEKAWITGGETRVIRRKVVCFDGY